jgi:uncharacterized protein involved in exopolysaccharide biosynthesis
MRGPRPLPEPAGSPDEIPSLAEVARFLVRYRWLILGAALVASIVTFVVLRWVKPPRYRAVATLIAAPPQLPGSLRPKELPVQTYERLLASDAVLSETRRRLVEDEVIEPGQPLRLGDELAIELSVAERTELPLAPIVEVVAFSWDPERAATVANVWSAVFLERWGTLIGDDSGTSSDFVASELAEAREELARLQQKADEAAGESDQAVAEAQRRWDRRLATAAEEAEAVVNAHRRKNDAAIAAYNDETRLLMRARAAERLAVADQQRPLLLQILSLRTRLAQSPEVVLLERAAPGGSVSVELPSAAETVRMEEINPLHAELTLKLSELESQVEASIGEGGAEGVRTLLADLEQVQRQRLAGLRELQAERVVELDRLRRQQRLAFEELRRARQRELFTLSRRRQAGEAALSRELAPVQQLFDQLSRSLGDAELASSSRELPEVRLASAASPPVTAQPRRAGFYAVVALVLGGFAGLTLAIARELSSVRLREEPV